MSIRRGVEREAEMLLPSRVEDYVGPDNPVRVIEAFVENLELGGWKGQDRAEGSVGAPSYDAGAMIKLLIYGYLNRIRSSRELEKAAKRNLELIWLMRALSPDHWTINAFRRANRERFKGIFREFNLVCAGLGLFGQELVAIDSAFFKGVNNPSRNFTQAKLEAKLAEIDRRTEEYLKQLEAAESQAARQGSGEAGGSVREKIEQLGQRRQRCRELLQAVEQSPSGQISLTDPDSRALKKSADQVVGYNVQIAVESKNHLIVANQVAQKGHDHDQLTAMGQAAQEQLGVERLKVVADAGYYNVDQIKACAQQGLEVYMPIPLPKDAGDGTFSAADFHHDSSRDVVICPQGKELIRHEDTQQRGALYRVYYNTAACRGCILLGSCTKGRYRKIKLHVDAALVTQLRQRNQAAPQILALRKQIVEHPFGTMKFWMGARALLTRGWQSVSAEIHLTCLAYNFRRVLNLLTVPDLLKALHPAPPPVSSLSPYL